MTFKGFTAVQPEIIIDSDKPEYNTNWNVVFADCSQVTGCDFMVVSLHIYCAPTEGYYLQLSSVRRSQADERELSGLTNRMYNKTKEAVES